MRVIVTNHALERAQERFGWQGSREALENSLMSLRGMSAGLAIQTGEDWFVKIPEIRMILVMKGPVLVTVMGFEKNAAEAIAA